MLTKRIIPCLDVTDGRVVKGTNFVNLRDAGDPVDCAVEFNRQGADELVFLDITASSDGRKTMVDVVRRTAERCFMPVTVGGGIRTVEDMREKSLRYGRLGAEKLRARGRRGGLAPAMLHAGWTFVRGYLLRGGFLDGRAGYTIARLNALGSWVKYREAG